MPIGLLVMRLELHLDSVTGRMIQLVLVLIYFDLIQVSERLVPRQ